MDRRKVRQIAKISGLSEEVVRAVLVAELVRSAQEFLKSDMKYSTNMYGDLIPLSDTDYDVCQVKLSKEFLDILDGHPSDEILEYL